jgi:hypothetical protein
MWLDLRPCQNWKRYEWIAAMPDWEKCGSAYGFAKTGKDVTRITAMPKMEEMLLDLQLCQNWDRCGSIMAMPKWERHGSMYGCVKSGRDVVKRTTMAQKNLTHVFSRSLLLPDVFWILKYAAFIFIFSVH